jgi:hypothetical protein
VSDCQQESCDEFCEQELPPVAASGSGAAHDATVLIQDNTG